MLKKQVQVKINMPLKLKKAIEKKAKKYDLTLASYIKYTMYNQLSGENVPVFKASASVDKAYKDIIDGKSELVSFKSADEIEKYLEKRINLASGLQTKLKNSKKD